MDLCPIAEDVDLSEDMVITFTPTDESIRIIAVQEPRIIQEVAAERGVADVLVRVPALVRAADARDVAKRIPIQKGFKRKINYLHRRLI